MSTAPPMPPWSRAILLMVSVAWTAFIVSSFLNGVTPSAVFFAIPAATYATLATTGGGAGRRKLKVSYEEDNKTEQEDAKT